MILCGILIFIDLPFKAIASQLISGPVLGAIGSLTAAGIAACTIGFQYYRYQKERLPVVSPLVKSFEIENLRLNSDWDTKRVNTEKWSNTYLSLVNYGNMPLIDVDYSFSLENFEDTKNEIDRIEKRNNRPFKLELKDPEYKKETLTKANMIWQIGENSPDRDLTIQRPMLKANSIKPGEEIQLRLPTYFLMLNNYVLLTSSQTALSNFKLDKRPKINLFITCTDMDQRKWKIIYTLKLDNRASLAKEGWSKFILTFDFVTRKKLKKK